ncbi:MAG: tetratricopeptide repeat protein [Alphaproteobacteria bacterium]
MKFLVKLLAIICIPGLAFATENTEILVLDATVKNKIVTNAEVIFQKSGETSVKTKTDTEGKVNLSTPFGSDTQDTTLIIKADGYSTLAVKCPCNDLTYAISPKMKNLDGMRVVLTWGEYPKDLDSHLVFSSSHVFYQQKIGVEANLDVDDTDSFGPETITIEKKKQGEKYYYGVHDYSNRGKNLKNLSESGAKAFVYIGSTLIKTYSVPTNKKGSFWAVFYVNESGEIVDVNKMANEEESSKIATLLPHVSENPEAKYVSDSDKTNSKKLNMQGEKKYHEKNYAEAIELYQQAIDLNPNNGQAYSNLGLAFQKNNNEAEAISLASGKNKNTIQASSFYNIARIYEAKGEFSDALQNYKWALEKRDNKVYKDAIARVEDKL